MAALIPTSLRPQSYCGCQKLSVVRHGNTRTPQRAQSTVTHALWESLFGGKKKEAPAAPEAAKPAPKQDAAPAATSFKAPAEAKPAAPAPAAAAKPAAAAAAKPASTQRQREGPPAGTSFVAAAEPAAAAAAPAPAPAAAAVAAPAPAVVEEAAPRESAEVEYLTGRANAVQKHFDSALGADDFMQRVEMVLYAFGFTGDNSIAMVNLCRDEVTVTLKNRIEQTFGSSFSTNGLGGVLTCGATGMGAGFSHSPLCASGRERYVFFSFPHISINSRGEVGPMSRPGRPGQFCACGALIKSTNDLKSEGLTCNCKIPGVHDALDPEMSILKQRIARRLRHEGHTDESVKGLDLVDITKVAERTISDDLEYLISKTVDTGKADYAVVTGVQIHNWGTSFEDDSPNMEFVAPTSVYVVVNGEKTHLDLTSMPPMTPRQMRLVAGPAGVCNQGGETMLREEEAPYHFDSKDARKSEADRMKQYISLIEEEGLKGVAAVPARVRQTKIVRDAPARSLNDNSTSIDQKAAAAAVKELAEIRSILEDKYRQRQAAKQAAAAAKTPSP